MAVVTARMANLATECVHAELGLPGRTLRQCLADLTSSELTNGELASFVWYHALITARAIADADPSDALYARKRLTSEGLALLEVATRCIELGTPDDQVPTEVLLAITNATDHHLAGKLGVEHRQAAAWLIQVNAGRMVRR